MDEQGFVNNLVEELKKELMSYSVTTGEALIYKVIVDENGEFKPKTPLNPSRGNHAFQTDILVKKGNMPLVVIETKYGGFSTHDVLTYSAKALKHKEIYPYLRYGLAVGGEEVITNKFFTHNLGFDFAVAIPDMANLHKFIQIVAEQISCAEKLAQIMQNKNRTKSYVSRLEVENA